MTVGLSDRVRRFRRAALVGAGVVLLTFQLCGTVGLRIKHFTTAPTQRRSIKGRSVVFAQPFYHAASPLPGSDPVLEFQGSSAPGPVIDVPVIEIPKQTPALHLPSALHAREKPLGIASTKRREAKNKCKTDFQNSSALLSAFPATDRSLIIISTVLRYRFLPASLAVRVVQGDERTTQKHLQFLFHRGLLNRFAFPKARHHYGEFIYYVDSQAAIELLQEAALLPDDADLASVRNNREKNYAGIYEGDEVQRLRRLMFLRHELAISRWHAMLELVARASNGKVKLISWSQGAAL